MPWLVGSFRSSHRRCSVRKGDLRNFVKFTAKHLCQNYFWSSFPKLLLKCFFMHFPSSFRDRSLNDATTCARLGGLIFNSWFFWKPSMLLNKWYDLVRCFCFFVSIWCSFLDLGCFINILKYMFKVAVFVYYKKLSCDFPV